MKRYIKASKQLDLYHIAHDMFNDLLRGDNYKQFQDHTADDIILAEIPNYLTNGEVISDLDEQTIISLIYDMVDDYYSEYFGAASRNKYGAKIDEKYHGQIITKRIAKANDRYPSIGLKVVEEELGIPPSVTVKALEGMCFNNEACEINDSEYYVGPCSEYRKNR